MRAYVGLGSNLGDRGAFLRRAVRLLGSRMRLVALSSFRETEPWGFTEQPNFLNAVAEFDTDLSPRALLEVLLDVERQLGRMRVGPRYGPRTIDLDLLLYGEVELDEPGLTVPHPRLQERRFVLEPLAELDPDLFVPGRGRVSDLLRELDSAP
jgi:2-amino-4-hydroxy-6-hydroxymethyldihydropteridine diphosphokinase